MEAARRGKLLAHRRQKELGIRPIETRRNDVRSLPGVELDDGISIQADITVYVCRP
jgi:hypothetical protein